MAIITLRSYFKGWSQELDKLVAVEAHYRRDATRLAHLPKFEPDPRPQGYSLSHGLTPSNLYNSNVTYDMRPCSVSTGLLGNSADHTSTNSRTDSYGRFRR